MHVFQQSNDGTHFVVFSLQSCTGLKRRWIQILEMFLLFDEFLLLLLFFVVHVCFDACHVVVFFEVYRIPKRAVSLADGLDECLECGGILVGCFIGCRGHIGEGDDEEVEMTDLTGAVRVIKGHSVSWPRHYLACYNP